MPPFLRFLTTAVLLGLWTRGQLSAAGDWSQFRGPNASGIAVGTDPLPTEIGPTTAVLWKTALAPGHSSPVVQGERVFLTTVDGRRLATVALDREHGQILWQAPAEHQGLEEIHAIGSHAQPSPAADAHRVVTLFGSCGLQCYDHAGNVLWKLPLGPFKNNYGCGSSPLLYDGRVILNQDHDTDSFLLVLNAENGEPLWKVERHEFPRGYATPVIWDHGGSRQIVVVGTLRTVAYDWDTGREVWSVGGLARIANMTPVVGSDGFLYVAAWAPGGDEGDRIHAVPFAEVTARQDANADGVLAESEMPNGPLVSRFDQIDRDKSGQITAAEYESMRQVFDLAENQFVAIRPGGQGDITDTHVVWSQRRNLPYCPSPLFHEGHLFLVKNGGIVTSLAADSGQIVKQGRVAGTGNYYASPVVGDGKIYLVSQRGEITVISAAGDWQQLSSSHLEEEVYATPALVDGRIYLRTVGHLYCFGP